MQEDYASDIARASLQDSCCHLLRLSSARLQQTWRLETNESVALQRANLNKKRTPKEEKCGRLHSLLKKKQARAYGQTLLMMKFGCC
jgi:hypothetical protein